MSNQLKCWCGNTELTNFSSHYKKCDVCNTLISSEGLSANEIKVENDETDFYGKHYWDKHQQKDLNQPDVVARSKTDIPERCLYWLRTVLKYRLPPASILELGGAHGGFVALLNQAGYEAIGIELSPFITDYAKQTFDVKMLCGTVEEQDFAESSLDIIALMDVLEHLHDPVSTMRHCLKLLKPDGILVIQCPQYIEGMSYEEMIENNNPFLQQLKFDEHLFLFSKSSIIRFFNGIGAPFIRFENAIFPHYDMFFVVGKEPLNEHLENEIEKSLLSRPSSRFVQAMIDQSNQVNALLKNIDEIEIDRAKRLELINELSNKLEESEKDRAKRLNVINTLKRALSRVSK